MIDRLRRLFRRQPDRMVECECGAELPARRAHTITAAMDMSGEPGWMGGAAISADYCPEHCPGGCNRGGHTPLVI